MLDPAVGIEKPGPNAPDLGSLGRLEHRLQPPAGDHLRVVVEKKYVLSFGVGDGEVVDPRVVERLPERDDPVGYRVEVFERLPVAAVVVDDQQLVVAIGRQPLQALQATFEVGYVVSRRDDDAHLRLALDLESNPETVGEEPAFYGAFETSAVQSIGESPARSLLHAAFTAARGVEMTRGHPAVVQDFRDVMYIVGSLGCSQD